MTMKEKLYSIASACGIAAIVLIPISMQRDTVAQAPSSVAAERLLTKENNPAKDHAAVTHANNLSHAFRSAVDKTMSAVVKISSQTNSKMVKRSGHVQENPFKGTPFEELIPEFGSDFLGRMPQRSGVGSGVIVDADGIVLTNNHVVEGADVVTVRTSDGREFTATDIKTDPESDVAVLRLKDAKNLTAAKLGNSDELEIGDWVIAIGNPFELEMTVSAGIISGKGRELGAIRRSKFLQTDAAINPGNSGGPLVNLDGEVIGINTAIASNSGGYQGIGFAIPSNHVRWIMDQLIKSGIVQRGYLGVKIEPLNKDLAANFGLATNDGVLINEVFPGSPADKAGMHDGDVVLKLNGAKVAGPRDLQEGVERSPIDSSLPILVLRDGMQVTLNVTVKALPENFAKSNSRSLPLQSEKRTQGDEVKSLGLSVSELNSTYKKMYEGQKGIVVAAVDDDGPAAEKGIEPGMLIRKVNGKAVNSVEEFLAAVENNKSPQGVLLEIRTEAGNHFIVLKPKA